VAQFQELLADWKRWPHEVAETLHRRCWRRRQGDIADVSAINTIAGDIRINRVQIG